MFDTKKLCDALKTSATAAKNLTGGQPLILYDAAKQLEDCLPYMKDGQTPAQALEQAHGDIAAITRLLEDEKRKNEESE